MLAMGPFGYPADFLVWCILYVSLILHTWLFFKYYPLVTRRWSGLLLGNGLITACLLGLIGLAAESYLRYVSVGTDSFGLSLPARRWFALHVELNSLGCRDPEWTPRKTPGVRRIAFVGDSFTYGWGVERVEDRFTDQLQQMFNRRAPGTVQVMNVAKPGWDTEAQVFPAERVILDYGADEIVLCYVFNDIEKSLPRSEEFDPTKPPQPRWFNPESSYFIDYLFLTLIVPRAPTVRGYHDWLAAGYADEQAWQKHQTHLGAIIGHCKDHGVALRVVLLPFLRVGGTKFDAPRLHAHVRSFFEANDVQVLDLLPSVAGVEPDQWVVNKRDAHPNAQAHHLFAAAIWDAFFESAEAALPGEARPRP